MTEIQKAFRAPASTFRTAAEIAAEARQELEVLNQHPGAIGLSTGLPSLDKALSLALEPGRLLTIAGRTGGGKTALLAQLSIAFSAQVPTYVLSLEDGERDLVKRHISAMSREDVTHIRTGFAGRAIPETVDEAIDNLAELQLCMSSDLPSHMTVIDIAQSVQAWKREHCPGHGVVIIDQLSHISDSDSADPYFKNSSELDPPPNPMAEHKVLQWKVKVLRMVAEKLGVTVILAHQLNDQVSDSERPTEKSIRSSRGIGHESDALVAVWVPRKVPNPFGGHGDEAWLDNDRGDGHIMSLKTRAVAPFDVPVTWVGSQQRFAERDENTATRWAPVPAPSDSELAGAEKLRNLRKRFKQDAQDRVTAANAAAIEAAEAERRELNAAQEEDEYPM